MIERTAQSLGGKARADKMSAEERSDIARAGAAARWEKQRLLPKATHGSSDHPLRIGDIEIPCYVLDDGTRVLSQRGLQTGMGMSTGGSRNGEQRLAVFVDSLSKKGVEVKDLAVRIRSPIRFRLPKGGRTIFGYEATVLADLCDMVLSAREANGVLHPQQMHIAQQCEALVRGFARVGIIALVDEATGYQEERDRNELHRLLATYLSEERLAWAKRFPDEFYKQIYRLKGWRWPVGRGKTPLLGHITNDIVYERLPTGVLEKLQELNPTSEETKRRKHKHHQFLSVEVGQPDLRDHILQIIPIMKISKNWDAFKRHLDIAFPKEGTQFDMLAAEE